MAAIFWTDEYSVGNKDIDQQHEHIVGLVNALETVGTSGEGTATADLVLAHLLRYLGRHFAVEERSMEASGYPGLVEHRQQHADCSRQLAELVASVQSRKIDAVDCVPFIRGWLHHHLLGSDQRYASWLKATPEAVALRARQTAREMDDSTMV